METAAGLSVIAVIALVVLFFFALPGLITGWILQASGRNFWIGFLLGMLFGPLGLLVAIVFAIIGKPQQHSTRIEDNKREYVDQLQINNGSSNVLIGLLSFISICALGGLAYMLYRDNTQPQLNLTTAAPSPQVPSQQRGTLTALPSPPQSQEISINSNTIKQLPVPSVSTSPTVSPTTNASVSPTTTLELSKAEDSFAKWTSGQIINHLAAAGLEIESPRAILPEDMNGAPIPLTMKDGMHFHIPSLCSDCGGRVFSFVSERDLEQVRRYYVNMANADPRLFSWVFVKDNVIVQINGSLPGNKAKEYEAALLNMKK